MSEIDVSKCDYYFQGRCGVSKNINYSIGCYANDCYYKQLQQLKQENEELKEMYRLSCLKCEYKNTKADLDKAEQKLERIKEYCKIHTDFCKNNNRTCEVCSFEPCEDIQILQIIEGE